MNRKSIFPSKQKVQCTNCSLEVRKDHMPEHMNKYHSEEVKKKNKREQQQKHTLANFFKTSNIAPKRQMETKTFTEATKEVCILICEHDH